MRPPLYEAQAALGFAFDVTRTGATTDAEEDHVMGMVGFIIGNSPVPEQVTAAVAAQGVVYDRFAPEQVIFLERRQYRYAS